MVIARLFWFMMHTDLRCMIMCPSQSLFEAHNAPDAYEGVPDGPSCAPYKSPRWGIRWGVAPAAPARKLLPAYDFDLARTTRSDTLTELGIRSALHLETSRLSNSHIAMSRQGTHNRSIHTAAMTFITFN